MSDAIKGGVDNGRIGQVRLPFYTGNVGVRERGHAIELGWFGPVPRFSGPVEGTLDGASIRVVDLRGRELTTAVPVRQRGPSQRAIVATAERVAD